ncbi:regulator of mushroom formation [Schizophyllum commune Loenen D]|nr:regulator of mushroom formation [Schizophyllum commune Loenen D]
MQMDCMPSMSLPSIHEMFPEHLMRPTPYIASPPTPQHELTHSYTTSPTVSHRRLSLSSPRQTASYPYPPRVHQIQEPRSHTDRGHIHLVNDGPRSAPTAPYRIEIPPAPQSPVRSRQRSASTASHGYSLRSAARPTRSHSEDYPEEPRRDAGCSSMIFSVSGYTARDSPSAGHREDGISASDEEDGGGDSTKKHVCTTCNKRFNRPSSLRIHLNTHTGATPFRCPWPHCGREFNVNSNMRRHLRNHTAVRPGQTPPPPKPYSPPVYLHSPPQPALSPPESNEEDSDDEDEVPEPAYSQRRSSFDYDSVRYEKPRDDRYGIYRMSYSHVRAPSRSISPASSVSSFSPRLIPISSARDPY